MSTADELSKLDALRHSGALTQEEFDAEKAKLLGREPQPLAQSGDLHQDTGSWHASDGQYAAVVEVAESAQSVPVSDADAPVPVTTKKGAINGWVGLAIVVVFVAIVGGIVYHVSNAPPAKPSVSQVCQDYVNWNNDLGANGNPSALASATSTLENDSAAYGNPFSGYASTLENAANNDTTLGFIEAAESVGSSYTSACDANGVQISNLG